MDSSSSLWTQLLIIILLTLINAIFASSELAYVSVNHTKMKRLAEEGNVKAQRVMHLLEDSDDFLATIQVAITLAGFLSSASAATTFADRISAYLPDFPGANTVAIVIVTVILSYISLVFGELFPKQIALQMPEKIAMTFSGVILFTQRLGKPFVWLLSASTDVLQRIAPIEFTKKEDNFTRDEMRSIIQESRNAGSIDMEELTMLQGVLSLDDKSAIEIMVPRTDTIMVDIQDDYESIMETLLDTPFSRIPVYEGDKDNVVGVIHMKNLLATARKEGFDAIDIRGIASEPVFIPATINVDDLLIKFRREQSHMAIIKDEYGGMEGIVTLEDVLEEIVGEIEDESDINPTSEVEQLSETHYLLNGTLSIDKFNQLFDEKVEIEEVDTIAGLMMYYMAYVPEDHERVDVRIHDWILRTRLIENGRIREIDLLLDSDHAIEADYDGSVIDEQEEQRQAAIEELEKQN